MSDAFDFSVGLFERSDRKDVDAWTELMTDGVRLVFGNTEPINGKATVHAAITAFFAELAGIKHTVLGAWESDDKIFQKLTVTYTRHDGSTLEVPAANILTLRDGLINEYLIYVDNSALFV